LRRLFLQASEYTLLPGAFYDRELDDRAALEWDRAGVDRLAGGMGKR